MLRVVVLAVAILVVGPGCESASGPSGTGCNEDSMCPTGQYCGSMGRGCTFDCREDRDCLAMGATAVCDGRGRCSVGMDGGVGGDAGSPCTRECDDHVYCNGYERCAPTETGADSAGCVTGPPPCSIGDCDEATALCDPCRDADEDNDGSDSVDCGGPDCDDDNRNINPGRTEICDAAGVDEDCNPITIAPLGADSDLDGEFPTSCCNTQPDGSMRCGGDCSNDPTMDPNAAQRGSTQNEICDYIDNDCDGLVDENMGMERGLQSILYADYDCDGAGLTIPVPIRDAHGELPPEVAHYARLFCLDDRTGDPCIARPEIGITATHRWVPQANDCDDTTVSRRPGGFESCANLTDDDCDGAVNNGCPCSPIGATQTCGAVDSAGHFITAGACRTGTQMCTGSGWTACSGDVHPSTEVCSAPRTYTCSSPDDPADEDCDGCVDNGVQNSCGQCLSSVPTEVCNGRDDNCYAGIDEIGPGIFCNAGSAPVYCQSCGNAFFSNPLNTGNQYCNTSTCQWGGCAVDTTRYWNSPPMFAPTGASGTFVPDTCPNASYDSGNSAWHVGFQTSGRDCGIGYIIAALDGPGQYEIDILSVADPSLPYVPHFDVQVYDWQTSGTTAGTPLTTTTAGGSSRPLGNTSTSWHHDYIRFNVDSCRGVGIVLGEVRSPFVTIQAVGGNTVRIASIHRL